MQTKKIVSGRRVQNGKSACPHAVLGYSFKPVPYEGLCAWLPSL